MTVTRCPVHSLPSAFLLISLIVLSACSSPDPDTRHRFTIRTEDGIEVATTIGGPKYEGDLFTYEKVLEIRGDPGNEESLIFRALSLKLDEEGNLYVGDRGNGRVAMFDREGRFVRGYGREGDGPGEFRSVEILSIRDEILSVYDLRAVRTTRFHIDGTLLDVTTIPTVGRSLGFQRFVGMYLEEGGRKVLVQKSDSGNGTAQFNAAVVGADFDTLWSVSTPRLQARYSVPMPASMGFGGVIVPIEYGPLPVMVYAPVYGLLVSDGDKSEFTWYDLDGHISRRVVIEMVQEDVTATDRARIRGDHERMIAEAPDWRKDELRARKDALQFSDRKPYWTAIQVDEYGYTWLKVTESTVDRREAGGILYRVLSPEGEYLGVTRWPTERANCWVTQGHLAFWEDDAETGDSFPVLYRLSPAVRGLKYP